MKISVITPSFNNSEFIDKCIVSVLSQNYDNFEHIVIDGGSSDGTIEVLKKYNHLKWISEPDNGQSDALCKALQLASGDVVGWINSDDYYLPNAFNTVLNYFSEERVNWLVGNLIYSNVSGDLKYVKSPRITYKNLISNPDIVKQPSTFFKRSFLQRAGGFDKKLNMVMDYDLWIRMVKLSEPIHIDEYLSCFVQHDGQKTSSNLLWQQIYELNSILKKESISNLSIIRCLFPKMIIAIKVFLKNYAKP